MFRFDVVIATTFVLCVCLASSSTMDSCESDKQMAVIDLREAERSLRTVQEKLQAGLDREENEGCQRLLIDSLTELVRLQIPLERALSRLRAAFGDEERKRENCNDNEDKRNATVTRVIVTDPYLFIQVSG